MIKISVKQSKTDPFHQGVDLYLGKTNKDICPVKGILQYLAIHGNQLGLLFIGNDRKMLTHQIFNTELDCILSKLKLDRDIELQHTLLKFRCYTNTF